jgi:DNA-binding response OmpR family regulator
VKRTAKPPRISTTEPSPPSLRTVLVVATSPHLAEQLTFVVGAGGHRTVSARTFASAKAHIDTSPRPDLIISEIKLGEHNGLHLAIRGQSHGIPAIVVGDESFENDARQLGIVWLASPLDTEVLKATIARLLNRPGASGRTGRRDISTR